MKIPTQPSRRAGFTLMEMLVVLAGLGLLIVFGCAIMVGLFKLHQASVASGFQLVRHETFADQFRDDVAHADAAPAALDRFQAGPTCLILTRRGSASVVYFEEAGEWKRRYGPKADIFTLHPGPEGTQLRFNRAGADGRLVSIRISFPQQARAKQRETLEIGAALGGDVR
jgi:prepilin-type N-terminal cleavage/methylation domain-containing protein